MKGKNNRRSKNNPHPAALLLLKWYSQNRRDLPWRQSRDPYKIWLSEIILQQTRVEQGLPYYERFVERFPQVKKLAAANMQEIAKLWQGLGYYSRAQNLHDAALQVCEEFGGVFPCQYQSLIKLKGVGDYTASAVASIAGGESVPALDGNAFRVFSRLFDIHEPIDKPASRVIFRETAFDMMKDLPAGDFNQAIMDLGALICKPVKPLCTSCPVQDFCPSKLGGWKNLPVKKPKNKAKVIELHYLVFLSGEDVLMQQRGKSGLWKNLCDFPALSTAPLAEDGSYSDDFTEKLNELWGENLKKISLLQPEKCGARITHLLTHRKISAEFWRINITGKRPNPAQKSFFWTLKQDIEKQALPKLLEKFLQNNGKSRKTSIFV
jgi:A/G-specific adenine glycosylase